LAASAAYLGFFRENDFYPNGVLSGNAAMQPVPGRNNFGTETRRSRWRGNAGLDDLNPFGIRHAARQKAPGNSQTRVGRVTP
jgi:hypothetical protein